MKDYTNKYRDLFLVTILIFIAIVLRVYRITEQSIWHEEFVYVANIQICDLWTNIKLLIVNVPEYGLSPGGLVLYYFWIRFFPDAIWVWRILPISFGIFSIVLLYYFGKWLKDWRIGFFAGLLMAISPLNIYIHQELKSYSFVLFFSVLSWFAFLRFLFNDKRKIWFWINVLSNLLLPWFHALYIVIPVVQFPLLIINRKQLKYKDLLKWCILNIIFFASFFSWEYWISPPAYNLTLTVKEQLNPKFIIASLFGVDCVGISNELLPHWKTNFIDIISNPFLRSVLSKWIVIDLFLLGLIIFGVVSICFSMVREVVRRKGEIDIGIKKEYALLYMFFLSPLPFLCIRIVTGEPFFLPLYFYHTFAFLYILISFFIVKKSKYFTKMVLYACFVFLFSMQSLSIINFTTRPDYKHAISYLEQSVSKDDVVLDLALGANVFEPWKVYREREDYEFKTVFSLQAIADIVLGELLDKNHNTEVPRVWVLMETTFITWIYNVDPTYLLVKYLSPLGIKINIKHFPGKFNLYVLKIERDEGRIAERREIIIPPFNDINYVELMGNFTMYTIEENENMSRENILRKYFSIYPPFFSYNYILVISSMIKNGDIDTAEKICSYLIKTIPNFYHVMFLNGLILFHQGKEKEAEEEMHKLFKRNYIFNMLYHKIWDSRKKETADKKNIIPFITELEKKGHHLLNKPIITLLLKDEI